MPRARLKGRLAGQPARCAASASRAVRHAARSHAAQPTLLNSSGPSRSNAPPSTSASDATCCQSTCATIRSPASWRAPAGSSTTSRLARTVFASISAASAERADADHESAFARGFAIDGRAARRQRDDHVDRIGDRVAVERHEARRLRAVRGTECRCAVGACAAHVKARFGKDRGERFRVIGRLFPGADQQDVARRGALQRLDAERGDGRRAAPGDRRAVEREAHLAGGRVVGGSRGSSAARARRCPGTRSRACGSRGRARSTASTASRRPPAAARPGVRG